MAKSVFEWTEDDALSLPLGENNEFERKGAKALDLTISGVREGDVRAELAKQLSAFANMGGGHILYGLADDGNVDNGGIARIIRGRQSTKEWLEDVIPTLTDLEIVGCKVHEIRPNAMMSKIASNKSLYVVEVPLSDSAPHQSKADFKYYVRLGAKSQPASHRLLEDIRNRAKHPRVEIHDLKIVGAGGGTPNLLEDLRSEFYSNISFRLGVRNIGSVRALNSCIQIGATIPINIAGILPITEHLFRAADEGAALVELKNPLYPGMGIILTVSITVPAEVQLLSTSEVMTLGGVSVKDFKLVITTFADSAPLHKQEFALNEVDPDQRLGLMVKEQIKNMRKPRPFADIRSGPDSWMS
jgi:Putative DNA-binding domain